MFDFSDTSYFMQGILLFAGYIRLLTFFFFVPFMGGEAVPGQARIAMSFMLSLFVYPTVAGLTPPGGGSAVLLVWLLFLIGKELLVGLILGYAASLIFWVMLSTGFILDNQRGAGMGQVTDPASGESTSLFGGFLHEISIYLFFSTGAFIQVIVLLLASYEICPPGFAGAPLVVEGIPLFLMKQFSSLMVMVLIFASPIVLVCLLSDISLGIINRFAPQLNVFFLSMPIKSALGLGVIMLYVGTLLPLINRELFLIPGRAGLFWRALGL
ncbi:MAG: type III secretion system export apparatus subunit SctT [Deltaproteobacteria bacterium]|nr:type III secretion system export apparatus subunit SctT [Deltaproteobacteria bacterium]